MNTLETLPEDVFRHLMGFLHPTKVIQMREVSASINSKIEKMELELENKMELQKLWFFHYESFRRFVSSVTFAPFTNFCFFFDPFEVLESETMKTFMDRYGPRIRRLRIPNYFIFMKKTEIDWLGRMTCLKELRVRSIKMYRNELDMFLPVHMAVQNVTQGLSPISTPTFPDCFRRIERFKCDFESCSDGLAVLLLLHMLSNLQSLSMGGNECDYQPLTTQLIILTRYLDLRSSMNLNGTTLKYLTFSNRLNRLNIQTEIEDFVKAVIKSSVRLQNTPGDLVSAVLKSPNLVKDEKGSFSNLIRHMKNMEPSHFNINFDGLEGIEVDLVGDYASWDNDFVATGIPNTLKNLMEIKFDARNVKNDQDFRVIQKYWLFLFGRERETVQEIEIETYIRNSKASLSINPLLLAQNFKALESLTLDFVYFESDEYANLLHELAVNTPGIRSLYLTFNFETGDGSNVFVGPNGTEPTILRMKKLRHLAIIDNCNYVDEHSKRVNKVPVLDVMKDVFPLLSLTCLMIGGNSESSVFKATPERAYAVLHGRIGKTLRYLTWRDCGSNDYPLLFKQIESNKEAVTSNVHPAKRCGRCENYENDWERKMSSDKNWLNNITLY